MSIEWMTHVWNNSKQKGSRLLMLLAIADYANDEGSAYPGLESLARKTRQTKRNAIRIIEKIVEDEELEIDTKASHLGTNLYQIRVSTRKPKKSLVTIRAGGGDILGKQGGDNSVPEMSPDPSLIISNKSSVESSASADKPRPTADPRSASPEIQMVRQLTGRYPSKDQFDVVIKLATGLTLEQCLPAWEEWRKRGYKPTNYSWLDWARHGIPLIGNGKSGNGGSSLFSVLQEIGINGNA
jgi:hypothetical protein